MALNSYNKLKSSKRWNTKVKEVYYEILVERKKDSKLQMGQIITALLAGASAVAVLFGFIYGILLAPIFGLMCYFLTLRNKVEYEYLYVDKELQIDRITNQSKRKKMETLDLNQLEILAPIRSHELDSYRRRGGTTLDYSSGEEDHNPQKYMLVVGDKKVIFEPTPELVKTIHMFAPRKVFTY